MFIILGIVFVVPTVMMAYYCSATLDNMKVQYADEYTEAAKFNFEWNRLSDFKVSLMAGVACYF